jgi:hypothetical protein
MTCSDFRPHAQFTNVSVPHACNGNSAGWNCWTHLLTFQHIMIRMNFWGLDLCSASLLRPLVCCLFCSYIHFNKSLHKFYIAFYVAFLFSRLKLCHYNTRKEFGTNTLIRGFKCFHLAINSEMDWRLLMYFSASIRKLECLSEIRTEKCNIIKCRNTFVTGHFVSDFRSRVENHLFQWP